ncbi:thioredoxin family protein [Candidatus Gracilibacteria bacterium]|nr:thioredoxin family protein [Candidatus Gracilibacteria bacterium]MCF7856038.1 thioredoxin family protein [Candidatus Gracilibacteria bacterium]MCF7896407.1 thioredoxin family protein [Candidatus Gracilibacteria bacterium]
MKVLKFGSIGCLGCLVMKPRWAEIEKENPWLAAEFIDVDENPDLVEKWEIKEIPEFIFLDKNEVEIERMAGEIKKEILVAKILELRNR